MTLKEIAKEAGVSISTVSRVINQRNTQAASQELRQRIWEIANRGGYTPSQSARELRSGGKAVRPNRTIACIYARENDKITDNPFFTGIALSFEKEALRHNYSVRVSLTALDLQKDPELLFGSGTGNDGILIIGRHSAETVKLLRSRFRHVVYAGLMPPVNTSYDSVTCNAYGIGRSATEYLLKRGHKKIAYIGDTENEMRYNGFCDIMIENGFSQNELISERSTLSMEGGYQAAKRMLTSSFRPSALFCMNDQIALGAIQAIKDNGLRIPRDISVIGVDDIEVAQFSSPKLTTFRTPMEELGTMAAKLLIDRIEGGHSIVTSVSLPYYLVERDSCADVR